MAESIFVYTPETIPARVSCAGTSWYFQNKYIKLHKPTVVELRICATRLNLKHIGQTAGQEIHLSI
jgi:hypothetical protein